MHHALEIQEILSNIFGCCYPSDLPSLARTCRAFKEPALDVLWEMLDNLSAIARCLPQASEKSSSDEVRRFRIFITLCLMVNKYSFSRPLTQTEWDILQSYTRRIRFIFIHNFNDGLDEECFTTLSNPPTTEPLFPNLRYLYFEYTAEGRVLQLPFPSLISLNISSESAYWLEEPFESFPQSSPDIRRLLLDVNVDQSDVTFSKLVSACICQWQNLQTVVCFDIPLDVDVLVHLSRMPALTQLDFALSSTLLFPDSTLFFSNLRDVTLRSESLHLISRFLCWAQLPVITHFTATIRNSPSRLDLISFWASVHTSNAGRTIDDFKLHQMPLLASNVVRLDLLLCLEDLQPCMAFSSLRHLVVNIDWNVGLTDSGLLALASTWPHLESLSINAYLGRRTLGGITPDGLRQLLQKCRSLSSIALAIDTRGYTELPSSGLLASLGLPLPPTISLNVLDSIIEAESVLALAAFFARTPFSHFTLSAWGRGRVVRPLDCQIYGDRWDDVYRRANTSSATDLE